MNSSSRKALLRLNKLEIRGDPDSFKSYGDSEHVDFYDRPTTVREVENVLNALLTI